MKWNIYCKCSKPIIDNSMILKERKEIKMFSEIHFTFVCQQCYNKVLIITDLLENIKGVD